MMDLSIKGSGSEDLINEKRCSDCQTTKTPLWRGGPAGPKSLCNACGIRQRKKRRALLGLNVNSGGSNKKLVGKIEKKERSSCSSSGSSSSSTSSNDNNNDQDEKKKKDKIGVSLKLRFLSLGDREMLLQQRSKSSMENKQQRKLGEEEQAAVLLMALSCGSLYV